MKRPKLDWDLIITVAFMAGMVLPPLIYIIAAIYYLLTYEPTLPQSILTHSC